MPLSATYQLLRWEQVTHSSCAASPACAEGPAAGGGHERVPPGYPGRSEDLCRLCSTLSGFKSFSLTSVELQMLTNSCVKLQTVHSIPLTINKEGEPSPRGLTSLSAVSLFLGPWIFILKECVCCLEPAGLASPRSGTVG